MGMSAIKPSSETKTSVDIQFIPQGYQRTEIGVIPEDWNMKKLGDYIQIRSGESPSKFYFSDFGVPYFKVDQLNNSNKFQSETPYHIVTSSFVARNSLIFPKRGASIFQNKVRILSHDSFMDTNLMTLTVINEECFFEYLYYILCFLGLSSIADTTSVPQINNKHIYPFKIPLPSPPEQQAIAETLSDIDALIESLEKLIAKKRDIKQATMQQLLTGKTRLPGFSGEWEEKTLSDIADIDPENLSSGVSPSYSFNYISLEQVNAGRLLGYSEETFNTAPSRARRILRYNDVLMSTVRPNLMAHFLYKNQIKNAVCSTGFAVLRVRHNLVDAGFVFAHLFGHFVNKQIDRILAGSNYPAINSKDVKKLRILCPPNFDEQKAITAVLSDMDDELDLLEQHLEKTKQIKQGMMQQLLTGKVRLVSPQKTEAAV